MTQATAILAVAFVVFGCGGKLKEADKINLAETPTQVVNDMFAVNTDDGLIKQRFESAVMLKFVTDSIDYDLSGSIHRADSCLLMRRGVCQAYCQLFYRIAEAAGLKVELIAGESRDADGRLMTGGHMWLFAYTRQDHGILLDPTWGAGYFLEQRYQKNPDKWSWFAVEPEWMLLTHYPDHEHYQLTGRHLSRDEFLALPAVNVLYRTYGIDTHRLFQMALDHHLTLPFFYNKGEGLFQLLDIPLQQSLRIGETYTFRVKMNSPLNFAILNQPLLCQKEHWKAEGAGVYSIKFMPRATGRVLFSLKDPDHKTRWNSMVEYRVETPTADDWAKVEQVYPLSVPDAVAAGPIDAEGWQRCGIDGHRLLACIREQHIKELPLLFRFFSNLLIYLYLPDKSDRVAAQALGISPFAVRDYQAASRRFTKMQTFRAIGYIREADARSKGIDYPNSSNEGDIWKELIYKIMH